MEFDDIINGLNKQQFNFINSFITSTRSNISVDLHFDWDDKSVIDYIDGRVPELQVRQLDYTKGIDSRISDLIQFINGYVKEYNTKKITKNKFLKEIEKANSKLMPLMNGANVYLYNNIQSSFVKDSKFIVVKGVGGIGKSHFLRDCQEFVFKNAHYKHLFLYGKNFKNIDTIPWNQIKEYLKKKEFLFVFDAVNELPRNERLKLYNNIITLKKFSNARIVLTYRTHSMIDSKVQGIQEEKYIDHLSTKVINFNGVDYYSAIEQICNYYKLDISRFYNIIETNNPMIINMLLESNAFSNKSFIKKLNENKNVTLMTHIFEYYIKNHLNKVFKSKDGKKAWEILKKLSIKMYNSNRNYFTTKDIQLPQADKSLFISKLLESGFIQKNYYRPHEYQFSIEQLSNYIIVRSAFEKITNRTEKQIIQHIKSKVQKNISWKEYLLYVIVDAIGYDVKKTLRIINGSGLDQTLIPDILANISFRDNGLIREYQSFLDNPYPIEYFIKTGGLPNHIFNCENYFYNYILDPSNKYNILKLYYTNQENLLIVRLKFNLNCINGNLCRHENLNEIFLFALTCLYVPNEKIVVLASKTIYDIIENIDSSYIAKLASLFDRTDSLYVKNNILSIVIYFSDKNKMQIKNIVESIENDKDFVNYTCIKNYCDIKKNDGLIISLSKTNLYKKYYDKKLIKVFDQDETFKKFFSRIRLNRLTGALRLDDYIELKSKLELLDISKSKIKKYNKIISTIFEPMLNCKCQIQPNDHEYDYIYNVIKDKLNIKEKIVNQQNLFYAFYKYVKETMEYFGINDSEIYNSQFDLWNQYNYESNYVLEIYKFAEDCFAGSLFCNYYIKPQYGLSLYFNSEQNRLICGYQPIEIYYDEKHLHNFSSPIQNNNIETRRINNEVEKRILKLDDNITSKNWAIDEEQTIKNISELLKPYEVNNEEWIMLFADFNYIIKEDDDPYSSYSDSIIMGVACNFRKSVLSSLDRYKTIERQYYYKSLKDYNKEDFNECVGIAEFANKLDITNDTRMFLPPSILIRELNLHYNPFTSTWDNSDNDQIIFCDNNACKYYHQIVSSGIYIKKNFYDIIQDRLKPFFYVFTERYSKLQPKNRIAKHLVYRNGILVKSVDNMGGEHKIRTKNKCKKCIIYLNDRRYVNKSRKYIKKFKVMFDTEKDD